MRLESVRDLLLPQPPEKAAHLLDVVELPGIVPELEDAGLLPGGLVRLAGRLGRRRRTWQARVSEEVPGRRLVLQSASLGVGFVLRATLEPLDEGSRLRVELSMEPPMRWLALRPGRPVPLLRRLLLSSAFFALTVAGLLLVPGLVLSRAAAAVAWALIGVLFVAAASTLAGTHRPRVVDPRRFARAALLP